MSDSNITKKAMAEAMKALMLSTPFAKISVGQICEYCHMNRKSFYYHFKDKQDLVNWIFQSEFISAIQEHSYDTRWDLLSNMCEYFYENRAFYRKALKIEGQNSFSDYFREILEPILHEYISEIIYDRDSADFVVSFFSDALISAVKRWLTDKNCLEPSKFVALLKSCIYTMAKNAIEKNDIDSGDTE